LIGFTTVMLLLSLVVTVLTQILANFLKLRSRHLCDGVLNLFLQLGWEFTGEGAELLAHQVVDLKYKDKVPGGLPKDAITREDLIENLLVLAQKTSPDGVYAELRNKIAALAPGSEPRTLLANLRRVTLELSVERPDLAAAVIRGTAMARTQVAGFASEVFGVFDSTMDQVSAKFTAQSRRLVAFFGIVLALALPLDTFDLLERFARSDAARDQAIELAQTIAANEKSTDDPAPQAVRLALAKLQAAGVVVVPSSRAEWLARWRKVNWAGVAIGALLLTLGAPFWFHLLKDLLKLRSAVAGQESQDRAQRQATLADLPPPGAASGEQGDLQAAG
jgi:hypothetical protein